MFLRQLESFHSPSTDLAPRSAEWPAVSYAPPGRPVARLSPRDSPRQPLLGHPPALREYRSNLSLFLADRNEGPKDGVFSRFPVGKGNLIPAARSTVIHDQKLSRRQFNEIRIVSTHSLEDGGDMRPLFPRSVHAEHNDDRTRTSCRAGQYSVVQPANS